VGLLVTVHEFGHFFVARRLGFRVLRFSVGFGNPLLKWTAGPDATEYVIAAVPLGGYVKLLDEREGPVAPADLPRSFTHRPHWQRIAVLLAGPASNLLFAVLVLWGMFWLKGVNEVKPLVGDVTSGSVAAAAGLKSGDRVADFMPGNGYFTRIFSGVVGPTGRVYAFIPAQQLANCSASETAGTKGLEHDAHYGNVEVLIDAADRFAVPEPVDLAWTAQNYHDLHDTFMKPIDIASVNAAIYRALKPGGVYLVIDHAAEAGSGLRDTDTLHRIDPASIRAEVTAAGFVFEGESAVLRNPDDSHRLLVFDPAIRRHTDQVVLKFRKPAKSM
jgi:predicted methyltransferase